MDISVFNASSIYARYQYIATFLFIAVINLFRCLDQFLALFITKRRGGQSKPIRAFRKNFRKNMHVESLSI